MYVADTNNNRIRQITLSTGAVTTIAGNSTAGSGDGQGTAAQFANPYGVAVDGQGNLYVADTYNKRIRKITSTGAVTTLAGSSSGFADGQGAAAKFQFPQDVAVDGQGNLYVADSSIHRIRRITSTGAVTTLAGSSYGSVDGQGTTAQFYGPQGVAIDSTNGILYVADSLNNLIRKITIR